MSNVGIIIEERAASLGGFLVGRLLPFKQKRMVGPFAFIDHMGPAHLKSDENLDVGPHPHIGLSTLTYLFEGSVMHRDSLGTEMEITPGAVNWMTAGSGIVHSERTPDYLRKTDKSLHGLQIWVALPKELEETTPSFAHIEADQLPQWTVDDVQYKLIAGELMGKKSGVPIYSPMYLLELKSSRRQTIQLGAHLFGESGLYILEGGIIENENTFGPKQLLVANDSQLCAFDILENSTIYIFGGDPFPEERFIYWNFVSTSRERIEQAKEDWQAQNFPKVPGETDWVPLPS